MIVTEATFLRLFSGVLIFLLAGFMSSCDPNRVYEKNKNIPDYKWKYDNVVEFPVTIKDTSALYNIYVNIRHTHFYPFRNLWLKVHTEFPKGKKMEDRIEVVMASQKGEWKSNCAGDICDYQLPIQENVYFNQKGTYKIKLEQNMRQNPLPGIMDMGIRVEKTGQSKQELEDQRNKRKGGGDQNRNST